MIHSKPWMYRILYSLSYVTSSCVQSTAVKVSTMFIALKPNSYSLHGYRGHHTNTNTIISFVSSHQNLSRVTLAKLKLNDCWFTVARHRTARERRMDTPLPHTFSYKILRPNNLFGVNLREPQMNSTMKKLAVHILRRSHASKCYRRSVTACQL